VLYGWLSSSWVYALLLGAALVSFEGLSASVFAGLEDVESGPVEHEVRRRRRREVKMERRMFSKEALFAAI